MTDFLLQLQKLKALNESAGFSKPQITYCDTVFFKLDVEKDGVYLTVVDEKMNPVDVDYRYYENDTAQLLHSIDNVMQDYGYRIQSQGISLQDYVKQMGMDMASFRNIFRDQAERQVKVQLALKKISELESIEPSEDEIEAEYKRLAEAYGLEEDKVKNFVPVDSVKSDLTTQKTLDMLKESAVAVAPAADAE